MELNEKIYDLRKKMGLSQEELAGRLNVSRQTVSKWELGDSVPDVDKVVAMAELFDISLDELVLDKKPDERKTDDTGNSKHYEITEEIKQKLLTDTNKKRAKKILKIALIVAGVIIAIDLLSMFIYFAVNGFPQ